MSLGLLIIVRMQAHADQRYLEAMRAGDFSGLDELYREHAPNVRRWVTRNNGSAADAQDVFQEAIIALHQKAQDPDFVLTCPIGALLFQICRNKWLTELRKKSRESEVRIAEQERYESDDSLVPAVEAVEEASIRQRRLDEAFRQLSEICQQLLQLLAEGVSSAEVAVQLSMSNANTVYRRKSACVDRWRTLFQAQK
jgi:RNA polymerase sigma factor (sigma-70 family)